MMFFWKFTSARSTTKHGLTWFALLHCLTSLSFFINTIRAQHAQLADVSMTSLANNDVTTRMRWGTPTSFLGGDGCTVDRVQEAALRGGVYYAGEVPRLYSSAEARACLRGKRVVFSGDSHSKQHFIGLVEVLTGEHSNEWIHKSEDRHALLEVAAKAARKLLPQGIDLSWHCGEHDECYGCVPRVKRW